MEHDIIDKQYFNDILTKIYNILEPIAYFHRDKELNYVMELIADLKNKLKGGYKKNSLFYLQLK